jgi:DNA-binding GntR family transcriptional regulator
MAQKSHAVEHTTLRDRAEHSLRELIVSGALKPGERVNEVALAAELGISRGPLREAIQGLVREGLLEIIAHRGAFVPTVNEAILRDLYEVRTALESYAVKLLTRLPRSSGVSELRSLVEEAEAGLDNRGDGYPNDADFHRGLFTAVGNPALTHAAEDVQLRISIARARSARNPQRALAALDEHRAIVSAIGAGRVDDAVRLLEQHLRASYEHALTALNR